MCDLDTEEFNSYLVNLEEFVFDEKKIVSVGWLSRTLNIPINLSKRLLSSFINDKSISPKLSSCWCLYGILNDKQNTHKLTIVPDSRLEQSKTKFEKIISEHIYSIQNKVETIDLNTVYLADQSSDKSIADSISLSNIKCKHIKIIENKRNISTPTASTFISKPEISKQNVSKPNDVKKPEGNALSNMFNKQREVAKKEPVKEKIKNEEVSSKKQIDDKQKSPAKKSPVKKEKASPKNNGGNIASFFTRGSQPPPAATKRKSSPVATKEKSSPPEVKKVENSKSKSDEKVEKSQSKSEKSKSSAKELSESPEIKKAEKLKSKSQTKTNKKKTANKKEEDNKRKRIRVFSDSSEDEEPEKERSPSPEPMDHEEAPAAPNLNESDDDDEIIKGTPEPAQNGRRKRKRELVTKTITDESGFIRTVKTMETVECDDSDGEIDKSNEENIKQNSKKPKVESSPTKKNEKPKTTASNKTKQPAKTQQTSLLNFFKKTS